MKVIWSGYVVQCLDLSDLALLTEGKISTDDGQTVTLADVLFFCTGATSEPPLGFPNRPRIAFREGTLATAGTCGLVTRLPLQHHTYNEFKASATLSFVGHGGFGMP